MAGHWIYQEVLRFRSPNPPRRRSFQPTDPLITKKSQLPPPYIDATFLMDPDFPINELAEMDTGTVVAELANGKSYTLSEAFIEGEMNYDSDAGTVGMKFVGTNGRWS